VNASRNKDGTFMATRIARRRSTTGNTGEPPQPTREPAASATDRKMPRQRKPAAIGPTDENVRLAAYYRYLERGGGPGDALGDWTDAERALKKG
jgi:hypothetical protein